MTERERLAARFEAERPRLRAIAYRLLGSAGDAEDAVQEAWLRLDRSDGGAVANLEGWLRTVVTRICLDMLRARASRREESRDLEALDRMPAASSAAAPEAQALVADAVSQALLVVLDRLEPAERIAFVLHDMFGVPFGQIAPIVERTPVTAKKLASRARQKVRGAPRPPSDELAEQRQAVSRFLAAARAGDLGGVLAVLAPDVVRRADPALLPPGVPREARGAEAVARGTMLLGRRARHAELALIDGTVGALIAPRGRLLVALRFHVEDGLITAYEVLADPQRLAQLDIAPLD